MGEDSGLPCKPQPIALDFDDCWGEYTINGKAFAVEGWTALDQLRAIAAQHPTDSNYCLQCGLLTGPVEPEQACGCGGKLFGMSLPLLKDVQELLRREYGCERVSNGAAAAFYAAILQVTEAAKKKS